jgi:fructokinase
MVCVIGEALIDLVMDDGVMDDGVMDDGATSKAPERNAGDRSYTAHPGGSPFNVAIGLARLGQPAQLLGRLAVDAFGRQLRAHGEANGVDLSIAVRAAEPSTLAVVSLDSDRNATYDFYVRGTADWQWTAAELDRSPADTSWVHTGSLASWTAPGAAVIRAHLERRRTAFPLVVSYDPNVRPALMPDHADAVAQVEANVGLSDVVKASVEDLAFLYPGVAVEDVLARWRAAGPRLVVVTDGANGARAITADGTVLAVGARKVDVVDTVGAGDAFMAGLVNALIRVGFDAEPQEDLPDSVLTEVLDEAILVAALTCARAGANPPTAAELAAAR